MPDEKTRSRLEAAYARGAGLFDAGAFFEAHEAWEAAWIVEDDAATKRFLQGLIQVAAAFHKTRAMGSPVSGHRLLQRGLDKLSGSADVVARFELHAFCEGLRGVGVDGVEWVAPRMSDGR